MERERSLPEKAVARLVLAIGLCATGAGAAFGQSQSAVSQLSVPKTTIESVAEVGAGTFKPPAEGFGPPGANPFAHLPTFCRVAGTIKPTADSNIRFEVWMPVKGWNGKLVGVGNGGFAGDLNYGQMADPLARGYAVATTDTGHTGSADDARWAQGHPEKVVDFGYRGIHEMTEKAKAVVAAYYGKAPTKSYFVGCSNGGRQALMEAQRYPDDYDGILAGAPANYWTHLTTQGAYISQLTTATPESYIPTSKLKAIEAAAVASCDGLDGLTDGLIDDPTRCSFDPATLLCKGPESSSCLTAAQVDSLKKIYAGPKDAKGGAIYPGLVPGGETSLLGWGMWVSGSSAGGSAMYAITSQFFKSMVFEDQSWSMKSLNVDRDVKLADAKLAKILNATDPNLKAFSKHGGRLIVFHGWSDAAIAPQNAVHYFGSVVGTMGQRDVDGFMRLYMVPGMSHCFSGPGPNSFGQFGGCVPCDSQHDMFGALVDWVEKGVAPSAIVASKFENDFVPTKPIRTRPLCPYPTVARYKGTGSTDDAANFACVTLPR